MEAPSMPEKDQASPQSRVQATARSIPGPIQSVLWTAAALAIYLVVTGLFPRGEERITPTRLEAGQVIDASITLITADVRDLSCASDGEVAGNRCGFDSTGAPVQPSGGLLAPYMTTDNVLFLVPDLWKEPALARRLEEDPPRERERSKRFTARCKMQLVQPLKTFWLRWEPQADWQYRDEAWVGTISGCRLEG